MWEIAAADLTLSDTHACGRGTLPGGAGGAGGRRGLSLRFPRFVRQREDKRPEEATTVAQLVQAYHKQPQVGGSVAATGGGGRGERAAAAAGESDSDGYL